MSEASAILVPSYGDTGPTVLKEALSQGLYSICYDNTGAKELVKRYVWGRLVTTGDINALKVAMVEVPSGKNMVVAEKVKRVLCHEKAWESLSYLYRDILSPVDFVVQRGSSPAIRQRVTHLRRICARLRSDRHGKRVVISCCTGVRQNLRAIIGAKFKGQKVIREINEWPLSVIWGENKIKQWFEVKVMPKFFNGFICISDVLVDFCREHGCKGSMILKMPMTVDMEEVESVIGESNGIGDYVCYAGSLSDEKDGVKTLISACSSFALKILNGLPRYEALQIMSKARCLVLARPDSLQARAGFPTKLGEYLTLGRPVVVTKVGEIPRFLEDNISAYLVEPGNIEELANKLREAFADTERSEVIGLAGKEVARAYFDWRNHEGELCEWMRLFI